MGNKQPIRILHVVGIMDTGGAETLLMNIYRNLDRSKIQFDFIVHTEQKGFYDNEIYNLGGKIYSVPKFTFKNIHSYIRSWRDFFKNHKGYNVIHAHVRSTATIFLHIAKQYGLTTLSHSHSTSSGHGKNAILKNLLQYPLRYIADYFFSCSDDAGKWLFGKKLVENNKVKILPNAINTSQFIFNEQSRRTIREQFKIKDDDFVVGHIGRFEQPKNHNFLIEIFREAVKLNGNFKLLLVGDGILRSRIEGKLRKLDLEDKVIFLGIRDDIPQILSAMDLFLFPSYFEGFGIVLLEAQASGLNCITSNNVPNNTDMGMGNIEYISLNKSAKYWANLLLIRDKHERNVDVQKLRDKGFEITDVSKWISDFYLSLIK